MVCNDAHLRLGEGGPGDLTLAFLRLVRSAVGVSALNCALVPPSGQHLRQRPGLHGVLGLAEQPTERGAGLAGGRGTAPRPVRVQPPRQRQRRPRPALQPALAGDLPAACRGESARPRGPTSHGLFGLQRPAVRPPRGPSFGSLQAAAGRRTGAQSPREAGFRPAAGPGPQRSVQAVSTPGRCSVSPGRSPADSTWPLNVGSRRASRLWETVQ